METRPDGSDRAAHDVGDFLVAIFLEVREDDHLALFGG
jgi:hypothetical protein